MTVLKAEGPGGTGTVTLGSGLYVPASASEEEGVSVYRQRLRAWAGMGGHGWAGVGGHGWAGMGGSMVGCCLPWRTVGGNRSCYSKCGRQPECILGVE